MSVKVENLEKNMARLTIEVDASELNKALNIAYNRQKGRISIPGFRRGKVPRAMVERLYGPGVFYEDAANILVSQEYPKAYEESGLDIVSQPKFEVVNIEKGQPFVFTAEVAVKPPVKLGQYEGLSVAWVDTSVSEEEIDAEIDLQLKSNARSVTVERAVEEGDTVILDFDGTVDGKPFEGGRAENYSLEIGSHTFIENFEEQLIGHSVGEEITVNVTFPEDYQEKTLAGRDAVFKVHLHEVRVQEVPELDEEYVQDTTDVDTIEEYREQVKETLEERKKNDAIRVQEDELMAKIADKSEMEIPDAMVDTQIDTMMNDYARNLVQSGLTFQQYLEFSGLTVEQFRAQVRPDALQRIRVGLCLEEIAKEQGITITDEDVEAKLAQMAQSYGMPVESLKASFGEREMESVRSETLMEKAIAYVMEKAVQRQQREATAEEEQKGGSEN